MCHSHNKQQTAVSLKRGWGCSSLVLLGTVLTEPEVSAPMPQTQPRQTMHVQIAPRPRTSRGEEPHMIPCWAATEALGSKWAAELHLDLRQRRSNMVEIRTMELNMKQAPLRRKVGAEHEASAAEEEGRCIVTGPVDQPTCRHTHTHTGGMWTQVWEDRKDTYSLFSGILETFLLSWCFSFKSKMPGNRVWETKTTII